MRHLLPFLPQYPVVSVIRLQGFISSGARSAALNDAGVASLIERAFTRGRPRAVALVINSPGGSPTQSSLIAARIRRLADEKKVPVHAFIEDLAASGGYWLATAADEIWVDPNSILGSIGVITAGFGFQDFIARYGVERRVYTAGRSKAMLDPFQPEDPDDVARLKAIQGQVHAGFIDQVKRRRGSKLADEDLFTGEVWVGQSAVEKGLADGIAHLVPKMKELFGKNVRFVSYQRRRPLLSLCSAGVVNGVLDEIESRVSLARFGL